MHTCIPLRRLRTSWHSCPRWVNASNRNTPGMHRPRSQNVTTSMVGLKKRSHTQTSCPEWWTPRDIAGECRRRRSGQERVFRLGTFICSQPLPRWPTGKASGSRAAGLGSVSDFSHGAFSGSSHTSDSQIGIPAAALPGTWCYRINTGTGWPSLCWLLACLSSQQHASVSQGWVRSETFMCCHTEIEVADQIFYFTQSQYTDTRPTSPRADPECQALGRVATGVPFLKSLVWRPRKIPKAQAEIKSRIRSLGGCHNH